MFCGAQDLVKFALSRIKATIKLGVVIFIILMFFKHLAIADLFSAYKTSPTPIGRRSPKTLHILS